MADLSPQAQAVLDAVCDNTEPDCDTQHLIAAALRAAAAIEIHNPWVGELNLLDLCGCVTKSSPSPPNWRTTNER